MAYIAKSTVLSAYQLLSHIDKDKNQGLTQKVSALKYGAALDMYFKKNHVDCDLKITVNRDLFASYVGQIVKINDTQCTKDFYTNIALNGRDFDCGSNFYSQSSVKDSKTNTTETYMYPKRSGWEPVMSIKNQVLIYRKDFIKSCIDYYLPSSSYKIAFVLWLLRFEAISTKDMEGLKDAFLQLFTKDYCDALFSNGNEGIDNIQIKYAESKCELTETDINNIFLNSKKDVPTANLPFQQIFYGAPGTGKSNTIKRQTAIAEEQGRVIRTTFHPDSDYSTFVGAYKPTSVEVPVTTIIGKEQIPVVNAIPEKKIVYEFVPQAFLKAYAGAWKNQAEPFFLIIEEINRGNCAQIFGDLFQLLDRNDEGESDYPISPDEDIRKFLLTDKKYGFAELTEEQEVAIPEKIRSGELLRLPKNLHIWATMNTSDQSLFPIDSAFKRRWDWRYMPISDGKKG